MCNNYAQHVPANALARPFADDGGLPLLFESGIPNLEPRDEIWISDTAPVVVVREAGPTLISAPWAWKGAHGKPVFNFRSEGRNFGGSQRCLIPADGFYEGTKKTTKWRFAMVGQPWFWIAGIVREGAFTMLTVEPGPDIVPYHGRQVVVLPPTAGRAWLDLTAAASTLLAPSPAGTLTATQVWPPI